MHSCYLYTELIEGEASASSFLLQVGGVPDWGVCLLNYAHNEERWCSEEVALWLTGRK